MKSLKMMEEVEVRLHFEGKSIRLGNEVINAEKEWKPTWQKVETYFAESNGIQEN